MNVTRISGALGAELSGFDLREPPSRALVEDLRGALHEHLVVFVRDQPLSSEQFLAFARAVGEPVEYPFVAGIEGFPQIIEVRKLEHERVNFGGIWHSDTTYLDCPPMGSMLLAREVPPVGGDTLFANQYLAWDSLSETMRGLLGGLRGIASSAKADVSKTREDRIASDGRAGARDEYRAAHPVARTHPVTGRRALYVNVAHTVGIEGMSDEESAPLLDFLFRHQVRPEFTCRFAWRPGSIAFWDNRCTQHNPINDYHGHRRTMLRITLRGDRPV